MTEETIISAIVLNQKYKLTAKERAAKAILEKHEAEMVELLNWLHQSDWQFSREKKCFDLKAGNHINGTIIKTINTTDLLTLFKNRNK